MFEEFLRIMCKDGAIIRDYASFHNIVGFNFILVARKSLEEHSALFVQIARELNLDGPLIETRD